jgi:hypothetical protein
VLPPEERYQNEFSPTEKEGMSWICRELFRLGYSVRPGRLIDVCLKHYRDETHQRQALIDVQQIIDGVADSVGERLRDGV